MKECWEWIIENRTWIFSGIGISFIPIMYKLIKRLFSGEEKQQPNTTENKVTQTTNINISGVQTSDNLLLAEKSVTSTCPKDQLFILFIDDEKFSMVNILKNAGWKNTKLIKDIKDMDDIDLKNAHIVFVDINGVGIALQFKNQGIGLASAIKSKYPTKKVVIYSGEPNGDRFDKDLRKVDDVIKKNAEPIEFMSIIEGFMSNINV